MIKLKKIKRFNIKIYDFLKRNKLRRRYALKPYLKEKKAYKKQKRLRIRCKTLSLWSLAALKTKVLVPNAYLKTEASFLFKTKKRKRNIISERNLKIKIKRTLYSYDEIVRNL